MKKRYIRGFVGTILMSVLIVSAFPIFADDIEDAKNQKEQMESELKDTESALVNLEKVKEDTQAYINAADKYITDLTANIYALEGDVKEKKSEIKEKKSEIKAKQKEIDKQYEDMKLRIKYMYETNDSSFVQMFLEADDFSEFLNKAEYRASITEYDRNMLEKLQDSKNALKRAEDSLQAELDELNDMLAEVEAERAAEQVLLSAKEEQLSTTKAEILSQEELAQRQKEAIAAQENIIAELEEQERRRLEEIERRKRENEQNKNNGNSIQTYDGGSFIWPLPGYSTLSSYFGYRADPFTGADSYHSGIDIPAPTGTEIVAAYGGEVAWSYASSSAGNWIGIDHGDGLFTVYMHMSVLIAKEGDIVNQGDVIGLVGSTGYSTGPHLHFSVRVNGEYVEPLDYVSIP